MTPFKSERTGDGFSYNKAEAGSSILDYELAQKLDPFIYDLTNITKL